MPKRIQRRRSKGWRMPAGAVYCGRPTKWGNPFRGDGAAMQYWRALREGALGVTVADVQRELRGKDLVCWCGVGEICHVDVLLTVANSPRRKKIRPPKS